MMPSTPWQWQFPPCSQWVPTDGRARRDQALKIVEEAEEVMKANRVGGSAYVMELMDVIHACETALREFEPHRLDAVKALVVRKNDDRGYYDERA